MTETSTEATNSNDNEDDIKPETLQEYNNDSTTIPLPPTNIAMHPSQASFDDDVSDKRLFNERFIESRVHEGMNSSALYMAAIMHNSIFMVIIIFFFLDLIQNKFDLLNFILSLVIYIPAYFGPKFIFQSASLYPIRLNRQAQCLHYPVDDNKVYTIPWKQCMPYTRLGRVASGSYNLMLLFPNPDKTGDPKNPNIVECSIAFDSGDFTFMDGNYMRLEFIRRYMEKGLDAIQPNPELVKAGLVDMPSGHEKNDFKKRPLMSLVNMIFYILAAGPLVDRWVKKQIDSFQWPDEVEHLCAEGANLSGIDTSPIQARTDLYYEFHGTNELIYVDANRNRVQ